MSLRSIEDCYLNILISILENRDTHFAVKEEIKCEFERVCKIYGIPVTFQETEMFGTCLEVFLYPTELLMNDVKGNKLFKLDAVALLQNILKPYGLYAFAEYAQEVRFGTLADFSKGAELSQLDNRCKGFLVLSVSRDSPSKFSVYVGTDDKFYIRALAEEIIREFNQFLLPYKTVVSQITKQNKPFYGTNLTFVAKKLSSWTKTSWYSYREWLYTVQNIFSRVAENRGYFMGKTMNQPFCFEFWFTQLPAGIRLPGIDISMSFYLQRLAYNSFSIRIDRGFIKIGRDNNKGFSIDFYQVNPFQAWVNETISAVFQAFEKADIAGIRVKETLNKSEHVIETVYEMFMFNELAKAYSQNFTFVFDQLALLFTETCEEAGVRHYEDIDRLGDHWFVNDLPKHIDTNISHDLIKNGEKVSIYGAYGAWDDGILVACPNEDVEVIIKDLVNSKPTILRCEALKLIFKTSRNRMLKVYFKDISAPLYERWAHIFSLLALVKPALAQVGFQLVHQSKNINLDSYHVTFERLGFSTSIQKPVIPAINPLPGIIALNFILNTKNSFELYCGTEDYLTGTVVGEIRVILNSFLRPQDQGVILKQKFEKKLPFGELHVFSVCSLEGKVQKNKTEKSKEEWFIEVEEIIQRYLCLNNKGFTKHKIHHVDTITVVFQGFRKFATVI